MNNNSVNWTAKRSVRRAVDEAVNRAVHSAVEMVMFRIAYLNLNMGPHAGNPVSDAVNNELENIKGETNEGL